MRSILHFFSGLSLNEVSKFEIASTHSKVCLVSIFPPLFRVMLAVICCCAFGGRGGSEGRVGCVQSVLGQNAEPRVTPDASTGV